MTIHLHDEQRFPCAPADLAALWQDPVFQEAMSADLGTLARRCTIEDGAVVLVESRDTGWRPHLYVTRLVTRWDGLDARWTLTRLEGPGDASAEGTFAIRAAPEGAGLVLDGTLTVHVPLLGPAIERFARGALSKARRREAAFARQWMQRISST